MITNRGTCFTSSKSININFISKSNELIATMFVHGTADGGDVACAKIIATVAKNGIRLNCWRKSLSNSGLILGLRPANERRRYKVTPLDWNYDGNVVCELWASFVPIPMACLPGYHQWVVGQSGSMPLYLPLYKTVFLDTGISYHCPMSNRIHYPGGENSLGPIYWYPLFMSKAL